MSGQVVEEGCSNVQWKGNSLWEWINFKKETGVKPIYWLIDHNASLSIIIHLTACRDLFFSSVGVSLQNIYPLRLFLPSQIVLHWHDVENLPSNFLRIITKICHSCLSWVVQYLVLLHCLKPPSGLSDNEGFSAFDYQCWNIPHLDPMGAEHRTCKSCDCNYSLDQPSLGGMSSWKTENEPTFSDLLWAGRLHWFSLLLHH